MPVVSTPYALPLGAAVLAALLFLAPAPLAASPDETAELGVAYLKLGDPRAEAVLTSTVAARPDHPRATHALGLLRTERRQYAEAVTLLERARKAAGEADLEPGLALAVAYQLGGQLDRAEAAYRELRQRHPQDARLVFNHALLALKRGDDAAARSHFRAVLELPSVPSEMLASTRRTLDRLDREAKAPTTKGAPR